MHTNDDHKDDVLSIDIDVEAEPNPESNSEPVGPRCNLEWVGDHAEVLCESEEDMARAREMLSTRPVKVKLRPDDGVAQNLADTNPDQ